MQKVGNIFLPVVLPAASHEGGWRALMQRARQSSVKCRSRNFKDKRAALTLLHTPVELRQDVVEQHVAQRLKVLGEDVADGVKCVIAGGGHPLGFLRWEGNAA